MSATFRLLVVDDEPDLRTLYELTLLREGYDVDSAGSVAEALACLAERSYSAVITDMRLPDGSGLDLLRRLESQGRAEKAIVITAYGSAENAVEALKAGAFDYLTKPVDLRQFRSVVASALGRSPAAAALPKAAATAPSSAKAAGVGHPALERLAGASTAMQQVRSLIERVARGMAPVMVCGESGTGKELVARALHEVSARADQPFIAVNCGAIPEHLLEAEFFGYRKGAFTGANEDRAGFFQAAQGGTLFLDEIGDLPLAMQSKLLRAIQERSVRPIGAVAEQPVNVRIVSATHKDLAVEVHEGRFRQDLYYRLNVIQVRMPPLRERADDLGLICAAVLQRIARDAGVSPAPRLSAAALDHLSRYGFPGNVRELENLLYRAVTLAGAELIERDDLGLADEAFADSEWQPIAPADVELPPPVVEQRALPSDLVAFLDATEREVIVRALAMHRNNRTAAGSALGLSLRQMRYRMARLGINPGDAGGE
ncbi:MAG: sigma-54-dependent Fis family transcriptional regulator [Burkholderiaceae bacterium]|nr:sigma-54-dependent Fis family transcriptional regulator [Burkholderiaceae bacterium]